MKLCINLVRFSIERSFRPSIAIVQVGHLPSSEAYIKRKVSIGKSAGFAVYHYRFSRNSTAFHVTQLLRSLNDDNSINGIILQLPLDSMIPMDEQSLINIVNPEKDVDGLTNHQVSFSKFEKSCDLRPSFCAAEFSFVPCTALACLHLIKSTGISLKGQPCTVVGRGKLVGAPVAKLLTYQEEALVTVCHSQTAHLPPETLKAKVLISAVGKSKLITSEHVSPGSIVIDCGITVSEKELADGRRIRFIQGDVDFNSVKEVASYITPVPGGVGPMTVAMLFRNTLYAALRQLSSRLAPSQLDQLISIFDKNANFSLEI